MISPLFQGLSAFPLTPLRDSRIDEPALPFPLQSISGEERRALEDFLATGALE